MADPAALPVKRCLGNVAMHVDCVRKGRDKMYSVVRWKIENFLMLKDTVRYKWKVETPDWILKLDKKRHSITVTIESENNYAATVGFVCYESLKFSKPVAFEQVFEGVYKAMFGPKIVNHKDNEILKEHRRLELCFFYGVKCHLENCLCPYYENKCPDDEMALACEVTNSLISSQYSTGNQLTDFEIYVEKETFYVHKAILGIRSMFFKHYIDECCDDGKRGCIRLMNTNPKAMGLVLTYIYEGTAEIPSDLGLRIYIFKLAHLLCLITLKMLYLDLLLRDINETNVVRIKEAGMSTGTAMLSEEADAYLSECGSFISEKYACTATSEHSSIINMQ